MTQMLLPTADGQGRVAAVEILLPDYAVRNLIRQRKVEQIYSVMQTGTARGMQTMEQSLCDLVLRGAVTREASRSSLELSGSAAGLLERGGGGAPVASRASGLRRGGELTWTARDETSIWKKEITLRRKPKPEADEAGAAARVFGRLDVGLEEGDQPPAQAEAGGGEARAAAGVFGRLDVGLEEGDLACGASRSRVQEPEPREAPETDVGLEEGDLAAAEAEGSDADDRLPVSPEEPAAATTVLRPVPDRQVAESVPP